MNRKEFFKRLGLGALVAFAAPKLLAQKEESHFFTYSRRDERVLSYKDAELIADESLKMRMQYPLTPEECYKDFGWFIPDDTYTPTEEEIVQAYRLQKFIDDQLFLGIRKRH